MKADAEAFLSRRRGICFSVFLLLFPCASGAEEDSGPWKIPILFSDHHADHAVWLLERGSGESVSLIVIDAHADTAPNDGRDRIQDYIRRDSCRETDNLFHNHDWIHPLVPRPVDFLIWISDASGFPGNEKYQGFIKSSAGWNIPERRCISLEELDTVSPKGSTLFVSIDLDFFYNGTNTPGDIPFAFDRLLDFSLRWPGKAVWAVSVSRAWLPAIEYAWELLEQSLTWLVRRTEFAVPAFTVFSKDRYDTSRRAASFRAMGMEAPGLYQKEDEMPDQVRRLLAELFIGEEIYSKAW